MSHIACRSPLVLHSVLLLDTTTLVCITLLRFFIRVLAVPIVTFASVFGIIVVCLPTVVVVLVVVTFTSHWPVLINLAHFVAHLISDLASLLSSAELSLRFKAIVPVDSNHAAINHDFIQEFNCDGGVLSPRILYKAKAAILVCFFV